MTTPINWTPELEAWLRKAYKRMTVKELVPMLNAEFGITATEDQVKGTCERYKLRSGRTGCFEKGNTPWNTGKKGYMGPNRTSFKRGDPPKNAQPLWHEREDKDGYISLHVPEPDKHTGYKYSYQLKHIWIWEQANGRKLPRGHAVIFFDGNKRNFDPDNLKLVTRAQLLALNRHNYQQQPDELKASIFALALMECEGGFSTRYTRSGGSQQARWVHGR